MKDTLDHTSEILEAHWNRKREPLEIIKSELLAFRKSTPMENASLNAMYRIDAMAAEAYMRELERAAQGEINESYRRYKEFENE